MAGSLRHVPNIVSKGGNRNCRAHQWALQEARDEQEQLSNRKNSGNYLLAYLILAPVTSFRISMGWIYIFSHVPSACLHYITRNSVAGWALHWDGRNDQLFTCSIYSHKSQTWPKQMWLSLAGAGAYAVIICTRAFLSIRCFSRRRKGSCSKMLSTKKWCVALSSFSAGSESVC